MQTNILEAEGQMNAEKESGVEQTDLVNLIKHREQTEADCTLEEAYGQFNIHKQEYCAVIDKRRVIGLFSRAHLGLLLGHRFGFSVCSKDLVRQHLIAQPVILRQGTPVRQVLEVTLRRRGKAFSEDPILIGAEDQYLGIISVPSLVRLQSALVEERFQMQESMHRRLVDVSRQAGMAEVASGVLHNVGNVLNSVNVSAHLVVDMRHCSRISSLEKVTALLEQHKDHLGDYLTNDPKGKLVPEYLLQVTHRLRAEQLREIKELNSLVKHVAHIKNIVSMQQRYAKVSGIQEAVTVEEIVEDGLRMNSEALIRHGVNLERRFEPVPPVVVDKHRVLQILVNLIRNAKYAVDFGPGPIKRVTVSIRAPSEGRVRIEVKDNGIGIAPENLNRIFVHGFTTKKDGHGFGLHTSAIAAKEMGGTLHVHSEGLGHGALFALELPAAPHRTTS
jgi:signal transduction histidine kinase